MRRPAWWAIGTLSLVVALAGCGGGSAGEKDQVYTFANCAGPASTFDTVLLSCINRRLAVSKLQFSAYGGDRAAGTGQFDEQSCDPSCAQGKTISYPVDVELSGIVECSDNLRYYSTMQLTFTGAAPPVEDPEDQFDVAPNASGRDMGSKPRRCGPPE